MQTEHIKLRGTVQAIGEMTDVPRGGNLPNIRKVILTIETPDRQILFPEVRNKKIQILEDENIQVKDKVEITISFQGSEKNDKRYNNIYLHSIKKQ